MRNAIIILTYVVVRCDNCAPDDLPLWLLVENRYVDAFPYASAPFDVNAGSFESPLGFVVGTGKMGACHHHQQDDFETGNPLMSHYMYNSQSQEILVKN